MTERSLGGPVRRAMDRAVLPGRQRTAAGVCAQVSGWVRVLTPHTTAVTMYRYNISCTPV